MSNIQKIKEYIYFLPLFFLIIPINNIFHLFFLITIISISLINFRLLKNKNIIIILLIFLSILLNNISLTKLNHEIDVYNDQTINKICLDVEENDLSCSESKEKLIVYNNKKYDFKSFQKKFDINFSNRSQLNLNKINNIYYYNIPSDKIRKNFSFSLFLSPSIIDFGSEICFIQSDLENFSDTNLQCNTFNEDLIYKVDKVYFKIFQINELKNFVKYLNYLLIITILFSIIYSNRNSIYIVTFPLSKILNVSLSILVPTYFFYEYLSDYPMLIHDFGGDGLLHETYANFLLYHLKELNLSSFLMGQEGVYYFMPGLRYFYGILKLFFSYNVYIYFVVCIFLIYYCFQLVDLFLKSNIFKNIFKIFFILSIASNSTAFGLEIFFDHALTGHSVALAFLLCMICLFLFFSNNSTYIVILLAYFVYFIRPQFLFFFVLIYILVSLKNRTFYNHVLFIFLISITLLHNYFFYEYCDHIGCAKLTANFFDNKFSDIFITSSLNYNKVATLQDYFNYSFIFDRIWDWSNRSFFNILIFISTFSFLIFAYLRKLKNIPWSFFLYL